MPTLDVFFLFAAGFLAQWALLLTTSTRALHIKEYCETEQLNASCNNQNDVILMRHARYGRMRMGRCVKLDYGHVGCSSDVLDLADSRCSGRRQCVIRIPDALFAKTKPCPEDLKPYMEATFECVKVVTPRDESCSKPAHLISTSPNGYISSVVTMETGCGTREQPWKIIVKPGQRINISLYDFGATTGVGENEVAVSRPVTQCRVYAVIRERTVHRIRNITICGTMSRERNIYISLTNTIEIGLLVSGSKEKESPFFLIKYEAVGCPDIEPSDGSWVMRKEQDAVIGCNHSAESWHLKCEHSEWVGKSGNCSTHSAAIPNRNKKDEKPLSYGLSLSGSSILIIIAVALTIGIVVLVAGLLCLRKQRARLCAASEMSSPDESDADEEKTYVDRNYLHYGWATKPEVPSPSKEPKVGGVRQGGAVNEYGQITGTQPCTPLLKKENRPTIYGPALPPCTCSHLTPSIYRLEGPQRMRSGSLEGHLDAEPFLAGSNPDQHQHYFVLDPDVLGGTRTYGRLGPKSKVGASRSGKQPEEIYQLRPLKPAAQSGEGDNTAALCECHRPHPHQQQQQTSTSQHQKQVAGQQQQQPQPQQPTQPQQHQRKVQQQLQQQQQPLLATTTIDQSCAFPGASNEYIENDMNERRKPEVRIRE